MHVSCIAVKSLGIGSGNRKLFGVFGDVFYRRRRVLCLCVTMNDTPGKMLSSLAGGGDKQHPKLGGCVGVFFHLFDWNRRLTGKKLFSNRLLPAERPKQVSKKYNDEKLPMAKLLLIADENRGGFPNTRKSLDSMCSSSEEMGCLSLEEGNENSSRAPGVVARLMGLESLPAKEQNNELNSKPPETRPLPELMHQRKQPEFFHEEQFDQFNSRKHHAKLNGLLKKSAEARPQKLQKTGLFEKRPVSKFQPDTLPFKAILSPSKAHHKLVSPIKSPGILSAKNAARLMEAAAKILEPGMQNSNRARNPIVRSSVARPLLKDQEGDEKRATISKRSSRATDPLRKSVESGTIKSLKGQALSKSWSGKEDAENVESNAEQSSTTYSSSAKENSGSMFQDTSRRKSKLPISALRLDGSGATSRTQSKLGPSKSSHIKKQQKTVSLALEAKANVQKREIESLNFSSNHVQGPKIKNIEKELEIPKEPHQSVQEDDRKNALQQCISGISRSAKQNPSMSSNRPSNQLSSREKGSSKNNQCSQQSNKGFTGEHSSKSIQKKLHGTKDFVASNKSLSSNRTTNSVRNFGSRKDGCKDKEDRKKKTEEKKGDSLVGAKVSPQKKRMSDGHFASQNSCHVDSALDDEHSVYLEKNEKKGSFKNVKEPLTKGKGSNGIYSKQECSKSTETYREGMKRGEWNTQQDSQSCSKSMDVVSFTFSSPMRSTGGSQTGIHSMEKKQGQAVDDWRERQTTCWRDPCTDSEPEKIISEVTCSSSSSFNPAMLGGDSLNALLEQKLRELTISSGVDLGAGNSFRDSISSKTTASILQDLIITLNTERPVEINQNINPSTGSSDLNLAGEANVSIENWSMKFPQTLGNGKIFQVVDKVHDITDSGRTGGLSGPSGISSRGRIDCTNTNDSEGATGTVCSEDCDQPSPVSILEASFSNESCYSAESLGGTHDDKLQFLCSSVQNRTGRLCMTLGHQELDADAELRDSASSANLEVVESDKIMGAILDISRLHKIDPSLIGLAETQPACIEDQELEYVRKIICDAELMSEDVALLSEEDRPDFLVDPNLFDRLEVQESSTDGHLPYGLKNSCYNSAFRNVEGSWHNRKLLFDCVKECLCSQYSIRYKGGYRTWIKGPAWVTSDKLAKDVFEEIKRWRIMAFGMLDEIVEKDMSTPMGKWTDFEREMFEMGVEVESNIFTVLVDEVVNDMLTDTYFT